LSGEQRLWRAEERHEDACSVRQSNTLGFISVNSRTYPVTAFRTICVDAIVIKCSYDTVHKTVLVNREE